MRALPYLVIRQKDHFISLYSEVHVCELLTMRSFLASAWSGDLRHYSQHILTDHPQWSVCVMLCQSVLLLEELLLVQTTIILTLMLP